MKPFTFFCHGTGQQSDAFGGGNAKSDEKGEIVHTLHKRLIALGQQMPGNSALMQGVASKNDPTQGSNAFRNVPNSNSKVSTPTWPVTSLSLGRKLATGVNAGTGNGVGYNIQQMIELLEKMIADGERPSVINMVGWSRGGVTCVRFAQEMAKRPLLRSIDVNICALDPVPGAFRGESISKTFISKNFNLPENIKHYIQIVSEHENGSLFRALRPQIAVPGATNAVVIRMPGNHSNVVHSHKFPSGVISMDIATRFLKANGSIDQLSPALGFGVKTIDHLLVLYGSMQAHNSARGRSADAPGVFEKAKIGHGFPWSRVANTQKMVDDVNRDPAEHLYVNIHHEFLAARSRGSLIGRNPGMTAAMFPRVFEGPDRIKRLFEKMYQI